MKDKDYASLAKSIKQAGKIRRGQMRASRTKVFTPTYVRSIREKLDKSQSEFAYMIGVSVATLQNWEQGRRKPEGPARALLMVAAENPKAIAEALG